MPRRVAHPLALLGLGVALWVGVLLVLAPPLPAHALFDTTLFPVLEPAPSATPKPVQTGLPIWPTAVYLPRETQPAEVATPSPALMATATPPAASDTPLPLPTATRHLHAGLTPTSDAGTAQTPTAENVTPVLPTSARRLRPTSTATSASTPTHPSQTATPVVWEGTPILLVTPSATANLPATGTPVPTLSPTSAPIATDFETHTQTPLPSSSPTGGGPVFVTSTATRTSSPTSTPIATMVETPTAWERPIVTPTHVPTPTYLSASTPAATAAATAAANATATTATATATVTVSPTPSANPTVTPILDNWWGEPVVPLGSGPAGAGAVVITEVAWGGTAAASTDEWLELYNPGDAAVDLTGWTLSDGGDLNLTFGAGLSVSAHGFLLLERASDQVVSDIPADVIYTGDLSNQGEALTLRNASGLPVDTANSGGGAWPAGSAYPGFYSMERVDATQPDTPANWKSNDGLYRNGLDARGQPLNGTPRASNSAAQPPLPTPTPYPQLAVVINEVAWGGTAASASDEWIELYNPGATGVMLTGWSLSDGGAISFTFPANLVIGAQGYLLLEHVDDKAVADIPADAIYSGSLNNAGAALTLRDPTRLVIDSANITGGAWPAGSGSPGYYSMERVDATRPDTPANWKSNDGLHRNGRDAADNPINGTPRQRNSTSWPTPTATPPPPPYAERAVIINEVAWAGTAASAQDEWLELYNPGAAPIALAGWTLSDGGDISITFPAGLVIGAGAYALLERTSDTTVSDLPADVIYTGGLNNAGEALTLRDPAGQVIDTANGDGGPWPAGDSATFASMERMNVGPDTDSNWQSNTGYVINGLDAAGHALRGTPRHANSANWPAPTATPYAGGILLNEFLPHPAAGQQEFFEIINTGEALADLSGWRLDDAEGGSKPYVLPAGTRLAAHGLLAFAKDETHIALNDSGDAARLLRPDGSVADAWSYTDDAGEGVSWVRFPDGGAWNERGLPTPGGSNRLMPVPPTPTPVLIGVYRQWNDGAWATLVGRVSAPAPLLGQRVVYFQDGTGGIAAYLGHGSWPKLAPGQQVSMLGYLRHSGGELQIYVHDSYLVGMGAAEDVAPPAAVPAQTGRVDVTVEGQLVTVAGRVTRLDTNAMWLDDGSGIVRVSFLASTGQKRPQAQRGETWVVTGLVVGYMQKGKAAPLYEVLPRYAADFWQQADSHGLPVATPISPAGP